MAREAALGSEAIGGRSSFNNLLCHPGSLLANVGQWLVLPSPQLGVHFLVKFCCHLCKEHHKQDINTKLMQKQVCQHQKLTFFFVGYGT